MRFNTLSCALLILGCLQAKAQDLPADAIKGPKNPYPFIHSILLELQQAATNDPSAALQLARLKDMRVKDNKVYLEFIHGSQTDTELLIDNELLRRIPDVETTTTFLNRSSAWVPIDKLVAVGQALPANYRMCPAMVHGMDNQGPASTNSDSYSGSGGAGLRIGIIDGGFEKLSDARAAGAAPTAANTNSYDYVGDGIQTGGVHGTACLETVFDHAPDALYNIHLVATSSDLGTAVNDCISDGVDLISHSMSWYNTGWNDGTGPACTAARNAVDNGLLFFNSAGNQHGTHWQGNFSNPDGDDWHNFDSSDEQNSLTLAGDGKITVYLQWDSPSTTDYYDLYLFNTSGDILASSKNTSDFEALEYTNPSSSNVTVGISVLRYTSGAPEFELFARGGISDLQYYSSSSSATSPSNCTSANIISVGAVPYGDYNDPAGTSGILASYSSRGPTNGGNQAPDICSPTGTTTVAYGGAFGGTSCATPNAAGTAAAFWSGHPFLSASGVRRILFAKAEIYKDWGASGDDNLYGRGGVFLFDYHIDNRYILSAAGNTASAPTLPYYSIEDVDNDAVVPENLRVYYLDKDATAPGTSIIINKPMLYRSLPGTTID
jgi:hypothetical protein